MKARPVELSSRPGRIFWYSGEFYQRFTAALSANSRMITRFGSGPPLNSSVAATDALNPRDRGFESGFLLRGVCEPSVPRLFFLCLRHDDGVQLDPGCGYRTTPGPIEGSEFKRSGRAGLPFLRAIRCRRCV